MKLRIELVELLRRAFVYRSVMEVVELVTVGSGKSTLDAVERALQHFQSVRKFFRRRREIEDRVLGDMLRRRFG